MDPRQSEILAENINHTIALDMAPEGKSGSDEIAAGSALKSRYRVDAKLGEGGMGAVYSGFDTQLGQKIAIKLLKRSMISNANAVNQLKSEALVAMKLTHPSIMRLINFEHDGDHAFLLMEIVEGRTLESIAGGYKERKMPPKLVAQIGYKVCEALEYAHANHVIHRDIKPANIMVESARNSIKLMDFGIARILAPGSAGKQNIMGTLPYIAPEIFEGAIPDARVDIYALGLTLYELLAGKHPYYHGKSTQEIIQMHIEVMPPALEGVDRGFMNIISQCVEKKPNARYQYASQLKAALAKYLDLGEAKVIREKKQVEEEKKRLAWELKKLEREKERLEDDRREVKETSGKINYGAYSAPSASSGAEFAKPIAAAAVAGVVAAFLDAALKSGEIGIFSSAGAYGGLAAMMTPAIVNAAPSYFRGGKNHAVAVAAITMIIGLVAYLIGDSYLNKTLIAEGWAPFKTVGDLTFAVPLAIGAISAYFITGGFNLSAKAAPVLGGAAALVFLLQYGGFAEAGFGLEEAKAGFFYFPFWGAVIWGAATVRDARG